MAHRRECDYPECEDVPERGGLCAFHTLWQRKARGEDIPERALEIAWDNPNDVTAAQAVNSLFADQVQELGRRIYSAESALEADLKARLARLQESEKRQ